MRISRPFYQFTQRGAVDGGSVIEAPAAPVITVVEPVTNPAAFDVDLPSGNGNYLDAAADDVLRIQITLAADTGFASVVDTVTHTITAQNLIDDVIEVAGLEVIGADNYIARARLERPSPDVDSDWSSTTASFAVPAGGAVPTNTVAPAISGNVQVGETLTTTNGTWDGTPDTYAYQWKRDGATIAAATASTHVLVELDAGAAITCEVTATNATGNSDPAASNSLTIDVYIVYLSQILDPTDATTYSGGSWDGVSLGTAAANRKIVIGYAVRNTAGGIPSIASSTVGAASGSEVANAVNEQSNAGGVWFWEYANTADATANIAVVFDAAGDPLRLGARLYAVYGAGAGTGYNTFASAAASIANVDVEVVTNGGAISFFFAVGIGNPGTVAWTGSTEDGAESVIEGTTGTIDSAHKGTAETATITADNSSTSNEWLITVAYGPSP